MMHIYRRRCALSTTGIAVLLATLSFITTGDAQQCTLSTCDDCFFGAGGGIGLIDCCDCATGLQGKCGLFDCVVDTSALSAPTPAPITPADISISCIDNAYITAPAGDVAVISFDTTWALVDGDYASHQTAIEVLYQGGNSGDTFDASFYGDFDLGASLTGSPTSVARFGVRVYNADGNSDDCFFGLGILEEAGPSTAPALSWWEMVSSAEGTPAPVHWSELDSSSADSPDVPGWFPDTSTTLEPTVMEDTPSPMAVATPEDVATASPVSSRAPSPTSPAGTTLEPVMAEGTPLPTAAAISEDTPSPTDLTTATAPPVIEEAPVSSETPSPTAPTGTILEPTTTEGSPSPTVAAIPESTPSPTSPATAQPVAGDAPVSPGTPGPAAPPQLNEEEDSGDATPSGSSSPDEMNDENEGDDSHGDTRDDADNDNDYVEAGTKTTVAVTATAYDTRPGRDSGDVGCGEDGCLPDLAYDGVSDDDIESRWSCAEEIVPGKGQCEIEFTFGQPLDLMEVQVAFWKGDERSRTLKVLVNGDNIGEFESVPDSVVSIFNIEEDDVHTVTLESLGIDQNDWISLLEVRFMVAP